MTPRSFALVPRTLRARLALLSFAGSSLVVGVALGIVWANVGTISDQSLKQTLRQRATTLEREMANSDAAVFASLICEVGRTCRPNTFLTPQQLEVAARQELFIDGDLPALGGRSKVLARPGVVQGRPVLVIVAAPSAQARQSRDRIRNLLLFGGPLAVGLATLGGWSLTAAALRPVGEMADEATAIGGADSMRRLPMPPGDDELAHLGGALNKMLSRIEASFRTERAFLDDASHELRTPLAILAGEIELGLLNTTDPTTRTILESLREETDRLARLADDLLVLSRASTSTDVSGHRTMVAAVISDVVARARASYAGELAIELAIASPNDHPIADAVERPEVDSAAFDVATPVPADQLERMVTNLLDNACRFAEHTVRVTMWFGVRVGSATFVRVQVADDGPGFSDDMRATAFDRFTVGDPARTRARSSHIRGGTGLGLAIVRALARRSGGDAHIDAASPLGGAAVSITVAQGGSTRLHPA